MVKPAALALFCLTAGPAEACRLALVLAMDVSSSVDAAEDRLQRDGLAAALLSPQVQDAFFISADPVALAVFEWSGRSHQTDLVSWTQITTPADLVQVSGQISNSARSADNLPTGLGHALAYAALQLQNAPQCLSLTVDVSGDGPNNDGFGAAGVYATFPFEGITVNGLAIRTDDANAALYYAEHVTRGPLSFVEVADGFADFEAAMTRKLIRELSAQIIGSAAGAGSAFQ